MGFMAMIMMMAWGEATQQVKVALQCLPLNAPLRLPLTTSLWLPQCPMLVPILLYVLFQLQQAQENCRVNA